MGGGLKYPLRPPSILDKNSPIGIGLKLLSDQKCGRYF